jgi:hypothetical protein
MALYVPPPAIANADGVAACDRTRAFLATLDTSGPDIQTGVDVLARNNMCKLGMLKHAADSKGKVKELPKFKDAAGADVPVADEICAKFIVEKAIEYFRLGLTVHIPKLAGLKMIYTPEREDIDKLEDHVKKFTVHKFDIKGLVKGEFLHSFGRFSASMFCLELVDEKEEVETLIEQFEAVPDEDREAVIAKMMALLRKSASKAKSSISYKQKVKEFFVAVGLEDKFDSWADGVLTKRKLGKLESGTRRSRSRRRRSRSRSRPRAPPAGGAPQQRGRFCFDACEGRGCKRGGPKPDGTCTFAIHTPRSEMEEFMKAEYDKAVKDVEEAMRKKRSGGRR